MLHSPQKVSTSGVSSCLHVHRFILIFSVQLFVALLLPITLAAQERSKTDPVNNKAEYEQSYAWRIKQANLNGQYIPTDLQDALKQLDELTEDNSKKRFSKLSETDAEHKLFFSLGRWMSSNWAFYEGSRFSAYLRKEGLQHPDDMTEFMMLSYHRYLNKKPLETTALIAKYAEKRKKEREAKMKK